MLLKMASKKKMRGGGMAKAAKKNMMRGGAVKKRWHEAVYLPKRNDAWWRS